MPETVVHFQIRMPPALHERLASRARDEKNSLNAMIVAILTGDADRNHAASLPPFAATDARGAGPTSAG